MTTDNYAINGYHLQVRSSDSRLRHLILASTPWQRAKAKKQRPKAVFTLANRDEFIAIRGQSKEAPALIKRSQFFQNEHLLVLLTPKHCAIGNFHLKPWQVHIYYTQKKFPLTIEETINIYKRLFSPVLSLVLSKLDQNAQNPVTLKKTGNGLALQKRPHHKT